MAAQHERNVQLWDFGQLADVLIYDLLNIYEALLIRQMTGPRQSDTITICMPANLQFGQKSSDAGKVPTRFSQTCSAPRTETSLLSKSFVLNLSLACLIFSFTPINCIIFNDLRGIYLAMFLFIHLLSCSAFRQWHRFIYNLFSVSD